MHGVKLHTRLPADARLRAPTTHADQAPVAPAPQADQPADAPSPRRQAGPLAIKSALPPRSGESLEAKVRRIEATARASFAAVEDLTDHVERLATPLPRVEPLPPPPPLLPPPQGEAAASGAEAFAALEERIDQHGAALSAQLASTAEALRNDISSAIAGKPRAFAFDVRRDVYGRIESVTARPLDRSAS